MSPQRTSREVWDIWGLGCHTVEQRWGGGERRLVAGPAVVLNHLDTLDGPSPSNAQPKLGLLSRCSQLPHTVFSCGLAICHLVSCMRGLKPSMGMQTSLLCL